MQSIVPMSLPHVRSVDVYGDAGHVDRTYKHAMNRRTYFLHTFWTAVWYESGAHSPIRAFGLKLL
jgi:hypothetical protein